MSVTSILEIQVTTTDLAASYEAVRSTLVDTRAFDGCLGVEVLIDKEDPGHLVIVETWESAEHDATYRTWRAGPGAAVALGAVLAGRPNLHMYDTAADI